MNSAAMNPFPLRGILLAAGYGRRFDPAGGRDKLLQPLADGRPVLWHSARALCEALPGSLAVLRPGQAERARWLREAGCEVVESAAAEAGMGAALAAGVAASAGAGGWLIALADMPWLPAAAIRAVATAVDGPEVVAAAAHGGRRGHPVGFGAAWRAGLMACGGDAGARELLRGTALRLLEWTDDSVLRDVDVLADLKGEAQGGGRSRETGM